MTEQEWLACTNPHAMLTYIRVNHQDIFKPTPLCDALDCLNILPTIHETLTTNKGVNDAPLNLRVQACDAIRCVVGNPFQPMKFAHLERGLFIVRSPDGTDRIATTPNVQFYKLHSTIPGTPVIAINPSLLTWNDGTIPRLAQAIMDTAKCATCNGTGGVPIDNNGNVGIGHCHDCKSTGHTTLDRDYMLTLADAIEEAGGPAEIVEHLRGNTVKCESCNGFGRERESDPWDWPCDACNGTGSRPRLHVAQCHAVVMWLNQTTTIRKVDYHEIDQ